MTEFLKYPRTHHIEGSRLQPGDEDLDSIPFSKISGKHLVVEEKIDGANSAISFTQDGTLRLQSRGHYLEGGFREKHFNLLKTWANCHRQSFWDRLGSRYIMYGEWVYAKHTVFYNSLPHYFLEFDIFDRENNVFLSTPKRQSLLEGMPVKSVPILYSGKLSSLKKLTSTVRHSLYKTSTWKEDLRKISVENNLDPYKVLSETDPHDESEGLYIKVEGDNEVTDRYKWIRVSFLTSVLDSGSHWLNRPIIPNILAQEVDIFSQE